MDVRVNKIALNNFKGDLDKTTGDFFRALIGISILSVVSQFFHAPVFAVKALLMFVVSVFAARETEIFFLTQKFNIFRAEAKEMLSTTKPEITGLILALLLPVGTPLFVVLVGSFVSIFIGKMVFGGYSYNVFNPAIVGRLFVGIAWPGLVTLNFGKTVDHFILGKLFTIENSEQLLSPLMEMRAGGIVTETGLQSISELLFAPQIGMLFAVPAIAYGAVILFFAIRKTVDVKPLLMTLLTSVITLATVTFGNDLSISYLFFQYFAGGILFVALFMMNDPFTKTYSNYGQLLYAVIFTVAFTLIRFLGQDTDGVLYALLFANLFVPFINKKTVDETFGATPKKLLAYGGIVLLLVGTGLFINEIIEKRITDKEIVVSAYVQD